ncbi:hypothetical protein [Thalassobacillus hwangdonensis]|uniref:Uncharacterized protein n=1 Tax=Thalassobacillus hwangdonensis TaxID=546108 RepID=A0ABW3L433_9BACI
MNNRFIHLFNIAVGVLLVVEGGMYIFMNNKEGGFHLRSILVTALLLLAWGMSYIKQVKSDNKTSWLIVTIIIMIPMILPWVFFI